MIPSGAMSSASVSNNGHCSITHGGGGLGPVMEIREMSGYCNTCVGPDKYYPHHHHPATSAIPNNGRHSAAVYHPQVFYTPPPPPTVAYSSSGGPGMVPTEWGCPPGADSFSHYIYQHHQYPPPPPPHHDYTNFLSIPTSCYDTDILMMGSGSLPPPCASAGSGNGEPVPVLPPPPAMANSYLFPLPSSFDCHLEVEKQKVPTEPSITTGSEASEEELDDDDGDSDRLVISIEDDTNMEVAAAATPPACWCFLCKKPIASQDVDASHHCSSPQLAKILENIDDDELDISVCSGDIEIGGIEDEMMQGEEQNTCKITYAKLAQLVRIPVTDLNMPLGDDETSIAPLCTKCHKIAGLAVSLDRQLSSVMSTIQKFIGPGSGTIAPPKPTINSTTQTKVRGCANDRFRMIVINQSFDIPHSHPIAISVHSDDTDTEDEHPKERHPYLCHICGRTFRCGRNLGKHMRRQHEPEESDRKLPCPRENCDTKCTHPAALDAHIQSHSSAKPYFCGKCLKLFTSKCNLASHIKSNVCQGDEDKSTLSDKDTTEGDDSVKKVHRCDQCGLTFRSTTRFQQHSKSPNGCIKAKAFACETCGKSFGKASELRVHEGIHSGSKSFPCDICGVRFTTKGNQQVHLRSHFTHKRFKCQRCDKRFTRKQTLQHHLTTVHHSK